jgi:hypothetical protein
VNGDCDVDTDYGDACDPTPGSCDAHEELCDGRDSDCDGQIDELCPSCEDGRPIQLEVCDGENNDCDGAVDEGFCGR